MSFFFLLVSLLLGAAVQTQARATIQARDMVDGGCTFNASIYQQCTLNKDGVPDKDMTNPYFYSLVNPGLEGKSTTGNWV